MKKRVLTQIPSLLLRLVPGLLFFVYVAAQEASTRLATILPVTTLEDVPVRKLPVTILSTLPDPSKFELSVGRVADPTLVPSDEIKISGSGTNWNVTLKPGANKNGTSTIYLRILYDRLEVANGSFLFNVIPVDDPSVWGPIPDLQVTRGETILPFSVPILDPDGIRGANFDFESSNPGLVAVTNLSMTPRGHFGYLNIAPKPGAVGSTTLRLMISNIDAASNTPSSQSFVLTVRPERFESIGTTVSNAFATGVPVAADFGGPGGPLIWVPHQGMSRPVRFLPNATNLALDSIAQVTDFDGDGRVDLILVNSLKREVQIWLNESNPQTHQFRLRSSFVLPSVEGGGLFPNTSCIFADFDGDGDLDCLSGSGYLYLNQGGGAHFLRVNQYFSIGPSLAVADFDGDGAMDLLSYAPGRSVYPLSGLVQIWHNNGEGGFELTDNKFLSNEGAQGLPATDTPGQAGVADFDGDGLIDVWMTHAIDLQAYVSVYLNRGGAGFEHVWQHPLGLAIGTYERITQIGATVADFDGDGRPDFLVYDQASLPATVSLQGSKRIHQAFIRNLGQGNFAPPVFGMADTGGQSWMTLADLDGDGMIDPILARATNQTVLFRNVSPEKNSLPGVPRGLRSTYNGSQLTLDWRTATDGNQTTPLTYEVRVGTAPGKGDILAALADPVTGRRLAWAPGNAGFNNFRVLKLPAERIAGLKRLYWSVQAIDASLAGGGFAPEATVELSSLPPGKPPSMRPLADVNLGTATSIRISTQFGDDRTPAAAIDFRVRITRPDLIDVTEADRVINASKQEFSFRILRRGVLAGSSEVTLTAVDSDGLSSSHTFVVTVPPRVTGQTGGVIPLQYATSSAGALWLNGESAGVPVELESSDDLVNWTPVIHGETSAGDALFVAPSEPVRFYRQRRQ